MSDPISTAPPAGFSTAPPAGFTPDVDQSAPAPSAQAASPLPSPPPGFAPDKSFQTSSGGSYTPGQTVVHPSGTLGEVTGQNPDTGNAEVKWHMPDQKSFKIGEIVRIPGMGAVTVNAYGNNGKLIVDDGKGGTRAVSPADVQDKPNAFTSGLAGVGQSLMSTIHGAADRLGIKSQGLDESKNQLDAAAKVNPNSGEAGHFVGDLVQFLAANGVVKQATGAVSALAPIDQYKQATKIAGVLADHPALAKLLHAGINGALTQGTIGGVQTGTAAGTAENAAMGAGGEALGEFTPEIAGALGRGAKAVGSAIAHPIDTAGNALGGAAKIAGQGVGKVADVANEAAEKYLPESLYPKQVEVPSNVAQAQAKLDRRMVTQPAYEQHASDIRKAFVDGLKEKGIDFQIPPDVDVRKLPALAKTALANEYKPLYGKIDEALENEGIETKYQDLTDDIKDKTIAAKTARQDAGTKPEAVLSANKALADAKHLKAEADAILKEQGLDGAAQRADGLYKASKAADDFNAKILAHTQDLNGVLPRTNPDGLNKALNNLKYKQKYQGNRLDQLFGEKAGSQLMADTRAAQQRVSVLNDQFKIDNASVQDLKAKAAAAEEQRAKVQRFAGGIAKAAVGGGLAGETLGLFK